MSGEGTGASRLADLGAGARTWIFTSPRPLGDVDGERIVEIVGRFLEGWESHGVRLPARCDFLHGRFLVVAADERTDPSGCSIDKLFHLLQAIAVETGTTLLESHLVFFRDAEGAVQGVTRSEFRELAANAAVSGDTIVFDTTAEVLSDVLDGRWERPARESWHSRLIG